MSTMLDNRKAGILQILVEEHIRTGEPVSSRAILESGHLMVSAATVRTELAALESEGYAVQPHTSAGRIPTARAYRYYVDQLIRPIQSPAASARVAEFFASVHSELGRLLKSTTALLSEITHYPSVVTGPGLASEIIRAVHIVQTRADAVLMVVVTQAGRVSQSLLVLPAPVDPIEVEDAELLLRHYQVGLPISQRIDPDALPPGEMTGGVGAILWRASEALAKVGAADRELYVGPASYLTDAWGEISKVRGVLEIPRARGRPPRSACTSTGRHRGTYRPGTGHRLADRYLSGVHQLRRGPRRAFRSDRRTGPDEDGLRSNDLRSGRDQRRPRREPRGALNDDESPRSPPLPGSPTPWKDRRRSAGSPLR